MTDPLKIGFMLEYGSLNGGENSLLAAIDCLKLDHLNPVIIAPDESAVSHASRQRGLTFVPSPWVAPETQRSADQLTRSLNDIVQNHQLHLLHANSLSMARKLGQIASSISCGTTGHLRDIVRLSSSATHSLNQHQGLIAVSNATREFHVQQGLRPEKVKTIHNGIDLITWKSTTRTNFLRQKLGLPDSAVLAATIGQICLRKGQTELAEAAVIVGSQFPDLHFLLIGERHSTKPESIEFDQQITAIFEQAGMQHRFHRLGQQTDIASHLNEIDLLIHPARQEPFGRVLLEAAAMEVPMIATDVGGTSEMLKHGESIWLVPPRNPQALADGIHELLTNQTLRERLIMQARIRIEQQFSIEVSSAHLMKFWRDCFRQTNSAVDLCS